MPKYTPTEEDLFIPKPCPVCGLDIMEEGKKTCSYECESFMQSLQDDMEWFMMQELEQDMADDWEGLNQ